MQRYYWNNGVAWYGIDNMDDGYALHDGMDGMDGMGPCKYGSRPNSIFLHSPFPTDIGK